MRLGALDFTWTLGGESAAKSLNTSIAMARLAEDLRFSRYWVGEHHIAGNSNGSPTILATLIAAATRRIRVGVGAVLMTYYSPFKVAEDFKLLEAVYGRMDLGVGRGRADEDSFHRALLDDPTAAASLISESDYQRKVGDLLGYLRGSKTDAVVNPQLDVQPEVWICGAKTAAILAAEQGASFCCTLFHGSIPGPELVEQYRAAFRPSAYLAEPQVSVAVCGTCADTDSEAKQSREAFGNKVYQPTVVGSADACADRLHEISERYGVDEIMFLDISPTREKRERSYRLLSRAQENDVELRCAE